MRTLLSGEFATATATNPRADVYGKLEVQNASGTWKDVAVVMGHAVTISARWSEMIDTPVSTATFDLAATAQGVSLAPLIAGSTANVDDSSAYAPLLFVGRLIRFSTATMDAGVALDATKYREVFTGRIDEVSLADDTTGSQLVGPITLTCSDLGGWLMDCQVETNGVQYGTYPVGTALESVMQNILTANIPAGEPAVTLVKESTSVFGVTDYQLGQVKLMDALTGIVLDAVGEDFRYRYDAAHVSQPMWFNPDRSRVTVDATFPADGFVLTKLSTSIANVRNYGRMQAVETSGYVSYEDTVSSAPTRYRRRMFQLDRPTMLTTDAQALAVVTAAVNDLSDAPAEVSIALPYCWFVQLFDRYTFPENNRQFDSDQTFGVVGYQHSVAAGRASTTITGTGRVLGAYAAWLARLSDPDLSTGAGITLRYADATDGLSRTYTITWGALVSAIFVYAQTLRAPVTVDGFDFTGIDPVAVLTPGTTTYTITFPVPGAETFLRFEPRQGDFSVGAAQNIALGPPVPHEWSYAQSQSEASGIGTATLVLTDDGGVFDPTTPVTFETLELGVSTTGLAPTTRPGSGTAGTYTFALALSTLHPITVLAHGHFADGSARTICVWPFDSDKTSDVVNATVANAGGNATVTIVWDTDTLIGANGARYSLDGGSTWTSTVTVGTGGLAQFSVARTSSKQTVVLQAKNAIDAGATWGNQSTVEIDALEAALIVKATRGTTTGNTVAFTVAAADPYPQASGSITVTAVATGGASVSPASQTINCTATTNDVDTTGTAAFTVTLGSSAGRVDFKATNANRTQASDAADVEQAPYNITLTLSLLATNTGGTAGPPYSELDTSWSVSGMPAGVSYDVSVAIPGGTCTMATALSTTSHTFTGVTFNTFGGFSPGNGTVTVAAKLNGQIIASATQSGLFPT